MTEFDYLSALAEDGDNHVALVEPPQDDEDFWFDEDQWFGVDD